MEGRGECSDVKGERKCNRVGRVKCGGEWEGAVAQGVCGGIANTKGF